ncbi:MAG: hypothetical protein ACK58L_14280 [Planctomycetota bacterium]
MLSNSLREFESDSRFRLSTREDPAAPMLASEADRSRESAELAGAASEEQAEHAERVNVDKLARVVQRD